MPAPAPTPDPPDPLDPARRWTPPGPVRGLVEGGFRVLARLRGARAFHPRGVTFRARATVDPASGLADRRAVDAVVRLSRGAGLPSGLPDIHGVAVRLLDAHGPGRHQDLLLATTFSAPVVRHLLRPAVRLDRADATTLLPYRRRTGERVAFRAVTPEGASVADVAGDLPVRIDLQAASLLGPWEPVGSVDLHEVVPDDLAVRFDPWNTTEDLVPAGILNVLRAAAYVGSRAGTADRGDAGPVGRGSAFPADDARASTRAAPSPQGGHHGQHHQERRRPA